MTKALQSDFASTADGLKKEISGLDQSFKQDFDEMSGRLTSTADRVKELITDLEGRTNNLVGSMTSLERSLSKVAGISLPSNQTTSAVEWDKLKIGFEDLKNFLKARASGVQDGRRRRKYENRDWRGIAGIIDDLQYDEALSEAEADAARDMNRLFVTLRFRPNEIQPAEFERFLSLKRQAVNGRI